jgi:hypothetical protein
VHPACHEVSAGGSVWPEGASAWLRMILLLLCKMSLSCASSCHSAHGSLKLSISRHQRIVGVWVLTGSIILAEPRAATNSTAGDSANRCTQFGYLIDLLVLIFQVRHPFLHALDLHLLQSSSSCASHSSRATSHSLTSSIHELIHGADRRNEGGTP